jgi:hypothetical protein
MQATVGRDAPRVCIQRDFRGFSQPSETRSNGWRVTHVDFIWDHACRIIFSQLLPVDVIITITARVPALSTLTVYSLWHELGGVKTRKARAVIHHFTLHFHMQRRYGNARYGSVQTGLKRSTSLSPHIITGLNPQVKTSNPQAFGATHLNRYQSTNIHPPWPITSPHCPCHLAPLPPRV